MTKKSTPPAYVDDAALEAARSIVAIDPRQLTGGETQHKARIQCIVVDAIQKCRGALLEPDIGMTGPKLHQKAQELEDTVSPYQLARGLIMTEAAREESFHKWQQAFDAQQRLTEAYQRAASDRDTARRDYEVMNKIREGLEQEREALAALVEWRPIEDADKYEGEFLLYGPSLIDLDFNEKGVVEGHWQDDMGWVGAVWCNDHDCWHEKVIEPTHFLPKFNPESSSVASLASRDAHQRAQGITDAASRWPPGSATRSRLLELADDARLKAEGGA